MNCPRCNLALQAHQAQRVLLQGCATCGGLWLDGEASRRVVEAIDPTVVSAADEESRRARSLQVDVTRVAPCPVCAQPLKRMPIVQALVDVDACEQHGVWFDRDELQRVIRAVAPAPASPAAPAPALAPALAPTSATAGGGFPAAAFFSPTNEAPAPMQAPSADVNVMPAAAFFTQPDGGAPPVPGFPGARPQADDQWGLGKTALVIGGGAVAIAGVGYLATHTNVGRDVISGVTRPGPSLSDVGSVISRLF